VPQSKLDLSCAKSGYYKSARSMTLLRLRGVSAAETDHSALSETFFWPHEAVLKQSHSIVWVKCSQHP
jgi:hypothetical protein